MVKNDGVPLFADVLYIFICDVLIFSTLKDTAVDDDDPS